MNRYPTVRAFTKYGSYLAVALGLATWAAFACALLSGLIGWVGVLIGLVAGALFAFFVQLVVELTRLIAEMLLPR
jgi:hypothetical protein